MNRFWADPLDLRGWPARFRFLSLLALTAAYFSIIAFTIEKLSINSHYTLWLRSNQSGGEPAFSGFAWSYLLLATFLTSWFTADVFFARRTIYACFGRLEGTLKHGLRFWRRVGFLSLMVAGLGITLLEQLGSRDSNGALSPQVASAMAVLVGVYFASFGWMYTRYEQEKSDRAAATLDAIRDQLYNPEIAQIYRLLLSFSTYCVNNLKTPADRPFNESELALTAASISGHQSDGKKDAADPAGLMNHRTAAIFFLNSLDQLAFGVRKGQFDLGTIQMVLRERFIRFAFRYHQVIGKDTNPKPLKKIHRERSQTRSYEHFLWLTSKMDFLAVDEKRGASWEYIILPPDHIVGNKENERASPPKARSVSSDGDEDPVSQLCDWIANWPYTSSETAFAVASAKKSRASKS